MILFTGAKKKNFKIKSAISEIHPLVREVLGCLQKAGLRERHLYEIKLALEEALINAVKHGNSFRKELPVLVSLIWSAKEVRLVVEDRGQGYDYSKIPDPTLDENIEKGHGRGVFLIRQLMDDVRFNRKGNRIEMVKRRK